MSKSFGFRLKDDVTNFVESLSNELNVNKSKVVLLLLDIAISTHTVDMIKNHYYNVRYDLFKHGNSKK